MTDTQSTSTDVNAWAVGWTAFAGIIMIITGLFHAMAGIAALVSDDEFFIVDNGWVYELNTTAWGWIHIIVGVIVLLSGIGLFTANLAARVIAIVLAGLSVIVNFAWLPYYPVWSIVMIALGIAVLWALTTRGDDLARSTGM
ncbi:MAG: hypothetical protein AAFY28_09130 [Actinomycetota bacterium]